MSDILSAEERVQRCAADTVVCVADGGYCCFRGPRISRYSVPFVAAFVAGDVELVVEG